MNLVVLVLLLVVQASKVLWGLAAAPILVGRVVLGVLLGAAHHLKNQACHEIRNLYVC